MSQNLWATIMPFGPVTLICYWPKQIFSDQRLWLAIISGTVCTYNIFVIYMSSQTTILYLKTCSFDCSLFLEFNARSNRQYDLIKGLVVVVQNKFVYYYKYQYLCVEKYDPLSCNIHINTIS